MSILITEDETTNESNGDNFLRVNVPLSKAYEYSIDVCGITVKMFPVERTL